MKRIDQWLPAGRGFGGKVIWEEMERYTFLRQVSQGDVIYRMVTIANNIVYYITLYADRRKLD